MWLGRWDLIKHIISHIMISMVWILSPKKNRRRGGVWQFGPGASGGAGLGLSAYAGRRLCARCRNTFETVKAKQKIQSTIYLDFDFETQFINSMLSENYGSYQTYGYRAKITREVVWKLSFLMVSNLFKIQGSFTQDIFILLVLFRSLILILIRQTD